MEARVVVRFARIAPRKARAMVNLVRGKNAGEALTMLRFTNKAAAKFLTKAIDSAVSNARQKSASVNVDKLYVKTAFVDKGPMRHMRRWRPRAMGRATRIVRGLSHITIILDERD
jgi:large subunit ribosomal protein L22